VQCIDTKALSRIVFAILTEEYVKFETQKLSRQVPFPLFWVWVLCTYLHL